MSRLDRRRFLQHAAAAGAAIAVAPLRAQSLNEQLNLGFIGLGGRGKELLGAFGRLPDVRIAALCDPDEARLGAAAQQHGDARTYRDLRQLLASPDLEAVVIATCNHWHALAAVWACQAGKDVYVEKPLAHNHWEGEQVVRAARKHDRVVQVGTQQRSDPVQSEIKAFLHDEKALGAIQHVLVCRFGQRASIGKRSTPLKPPTTLDYNLWLGPARDEPMYRDELHYDWHWDWNTGNGEMGNWGVHVIDDALNVALRDRAPFPQRLLAAGGRVVWNDAGHSPNVCFAYYDTGSIPVLFGLTNLPADSGGDGDVRYKGVGSGYIVECEGGYYAGGRGGGAAYDASGREIRKFKGDSGAGHARNFVDAVRARDRKLLTAEVEIGHQSAAWCNLANIACRVGSPYSDERAMAIGGDFQPWRALVYAARGHLLGNAIQIDDCGFVVSPVLEFDAARQCFVGDEVDRANLLLGREYREPFALPAV